MFLIAVQGAGIRACIKHMRIKHENMLDGIGKYTRKHKNMLDHLENI